ncbi:unnamed protein product [Anisakis simplex]|uniref:Uncharacterized protein n=1 Tax=Anisakis simplex TaxID=6269 RepID=A0A0M3JLM6_ANISI|nr:unnamed protein product [Anisakis simplex]
MANQSSSLNQLYPILPTSDSSYATMPSSSCTERIYDAIWTPTKVSDYQTNNMEFQSAPRHTEFMPTDENHHEHLVRLSFSPPHRSATTRRSRGKRSKFNWSRSLSRTSARSSENPSATSVTSCNETATRLRLSIRDSMNSRPSVPPPPPPPPPPPHFSLTPLIFE